MFYLMLSKLFSFCSPYFIISIWCVETKCKKIPLPAMNIVIFVYSISQENVAEFERNGCTQNKCTVIDIVHRLRMNVAPEINQKYKYLLNELTIIIQFNCFHVQYKLWNTRFIVQFKLFLALYKQSSILENNFNA